MDPTHCTWERTWTGLESDRSRRAFLFHLLSPLDPPRQGPIHTHKKSGDLPPPNCSRPFQPADCFPLSHCRVRQAGRGIVQTDRFGVTQWQEKENEGVRNRFFFFTLATLQCWLSRSGLYNHSLPTPPNHTAKKIQRDTEVQFAKRGKVFIAGTLWGNFCKGQKQGTRTLWGCP